MVAVVRQGQSLHAVARRFGVSVSTVAFWVGRASGPRLDGEEKVEQEISTDEVVLPISTAYAGRMIAIPSAEWEVFPKARSKDLGKVFRELACKIDWFAIKKTPRAPKKPPSKRTHCKKQPQVSSARILADRKAPAGRK